MEPTVFACANCQLILADYGHGDLCPGCGQRLLGDGFHDDATLDELTELRYQTPEEASDLAEYEAAEEARLFKARGNRPRRSNPRGRRGRPARRTR